MTRVWSGWMVALLSFGLAADAGAAAAAEERVAGQVVVGFKASAEHGAARRGLGARLVKTLGEPSQQLLRLPDGASVDAAVRRLERRADVDYAEPNFVVHAATLPNDPLFGQQWSLRNTGQLVGWVRGKVGEDVRAPAAWDLTQGSDDMLAAVVDTGIDYDNADVSANVWRNPGESGSGREHNGVDDDGNGVIDDLFPRDQIDSDYDPFDENGHGTEVAGVLAARGNDGVGMTGLAWRAKILPIRVLDHAGNGDTATVAQGFRDAVQHGAQIVNGSFEGLLSDAVGDVIGDAPNTLFVVAAGNSGILVDDYEAGYPCKYTFDNLLCVGATDATGALADFSNYGSTSVDLVAPGVDVLVPQRLGGSLAGHGLVSGTSLSSPLVAGAAVLRRSVHPGESIAQTRAAILAGARVVPSLGGRIAGNRSLDAAGALGIRPSPTPTPTPTPTLVASPAPAPRVVVPVRVRAVRRPWAQIASHSSHGRALLGRVSVRVPAHTRLTVTCDGRGCPFQQRAYPRRTRARVLVLRALRGARLRPGARLRFVLRPRRGKARVARYVVTRTGALRRR